MEREYYIEYRLNGIYSNVKGICVKGRSKIDAYEKAVYEILPELEGHIPWCALVKSVFYKNGGKRDFNTIEEAPY